MLRGRFDSGSVCLPQRAEWDLSMMRKSRFSRATHRNGHLIVLVLSVIFITAVTAPLFVLRFSGEAQIWQGYYLLVDDPTASDTDWIQEAFPGSLAAATPVRFTVFDGFEMQPADRLTDRLDLVDPRFDPFMRSIPSFFTAVVESGADRSLRYLATHLPPASLLLRLMATSPQTALSVLDFDVRLRLLFAISAASIAAIALVSGIATGRFALGLGLAGAIVPWVVAILNAGGAAVIAAAAVIPAIVWFRHTTYTRAAVGGVTIAMIMTTAGGLIGDALVAMSVAGATFGSIASMALSRGRFGRLHVTPMLRRRLIAATLSGLLVILAAAVVSARSSLPGVAVPAPDVRATPLTLNGLARLGLSDLNDSGLPTAADYVTHVAFQEGLPYGMSYRLPAEGEHLTLSTFHFDSDTHRVHRSERIVITYDKRWLQQVVTDARGVGRLLLNGGTGVAAHRQRVVELEHGRWRVRQMVLLAVVSGALAVSAALWARPARLVG